MPIVKTDLEKGLTSQQVADSQARFGKNQISTQRKTTILGEIVSSLKEPMFALLIVAAGAYLLLGESLDSIIMFASIVGVVAIHVWQSFRTDKSLEALRKLAAFTVTVTRDGKEQVIPSEELVPGDVIFISEGLKIPADCVVLDGNDLKVNEATLTGEPDGVWKTAIEKGDLTSEEDFAKHYCYAGTFAIQGSATAVVQKIDSQTKYGQIGEHLAEIADQPTPLQTQIKKLVKASAVFAFGCLILVTIITFFNLHDLPTTQRAVESLMAGLALAIALIPEEFPVILTVFLSMGAWRMSRQNTLIRKIASVETLGAVSVLAVDKTGTLTLNQMRVDEVWAPTMDQKTATGWLGLACETKAYDPMEKAMLDFCFAQGWTHDSLFWGKQVADWPFNNKLKMMGQAWQQDGEIKIAVKGSPESVLKLCSVSDKQLAEIKEQLRIDAEAGQRVIALAVATAKDPQDLPKKITDLKLDFAGLVALIDPPRENIREEIAQAQAAGIRVVMITGDNGITASSIARQVGIADANQVLTGKEIVKLSDQELAEAIKTVNVFARVTPNHKLKLIRAFQASGFVTAMTGDGVNDAPALRQSDIGIAMSQRGSDVAREAADMILLDDNFSTIIHAVADGRRIYANIKKSVQYILAIHMPIALSALVAPLLKIRPSDLLILPVFVVILELIIDPTCSIVLERGELPVDAMTKPPRQKDEPLITLRDFWRSIVRGVVIFIGAFAAYYYIFTTMGDANLARAMGLSIIILANLLLVQIVATDKPTLKNIAKHIVSDHVNLIMIGAVLLALVIIIYSPINTPLRLAPLPWQHALAALAIAALTTLVPNFISQLKSPAR